MPADRIPFQYAMVRVVPRIERGEFITAGVVLFCRQRQFLEARTTLDEARLAALAGECDPAEVRSQLETVEAVAAGDPSGGRARRRRWRRRSASSPPRPRPT